jgi:hypothetical protein
MLLVKLLQVLLMWPSLVQTLQLPLLIQMLLKRLETYDLTLTGTSGGARQLILGSGCQIEKLYLINNGLADAVTVKNTSGTGIAVPAGKSMYVYITMVLMLLRRLLI